MKKILFLSEKAAALEVVKNKINNVHLIKANIFDEIFFDEVFDIVCCSGVLQYCK